jgi:hypothetical protein
MIVTLTYFDVVDDLSALGFVAHLDHARKCSPMRDLAVIELDAQVQEQVPELWILRNTKRLNKLHVSKDITSLRRNLTCSVTTAHLTSKS